MKFTDFFDIEITPKIKNTQILFEGWAKPINLTAGLKSKVYLSLDDIKSVPTKFKLYFTFTIQFESGKIRQDFEQKEVVSQEKSVQTQIKKSMTAKTTGMVSIEPKFVDYKKFYFDVMRPSLSAEQIQNKLDKFASAGTFNLQDFSITKVEYPLVNNILVNDAILWKQFTNKDKKNIKASPIKLNFGYSVEFTASNKLKMYSRTEILELAKLFVPEFEQSILKDADYFSFIQAQVAPPMKEQNVYSVPLNIWKPGQNDPRLYIDEQNVFAVQPMAPPVDDTEKERGPILKGDSGKKIASHIASAINFAIGKFTLRELRPGRILTGLQELIRIIKHAYQLPPAQEFPKDVTLTNLQKWFNMHDPVTDKVPIERMEDGRLKMLNDKDIQKMEDDRKKEAEKLGAQVPYGAY